MVKENKPTHANSCRFIHLKARAIFYSAIFCSFITSSSFFSMQDHILHEYILQLQIEDTTLCVWKYYWSIQLFFCCADKKMVWRFNKSNGSSKLPISNQSLVYILVIRKHFPHRQLQSLAKPSSPIYRLLVKNRIRPLALLATHLIVWLKLNSSLSQIRQCKYQKSLKANISNVCFHVVHL